ncbi:hypothetical protein Pla163_09310 [Planctomycetes bacterium Pla163]|uniref:DUF58 domain-containing protein n=1 Tax=Rohdeia mirabilis TaxID=2528008 RepID=A0A518CX79_9BACT|nr:hypothetical protein Pla163_09310 [Planctomycetes bacterium Pla163]
MPTAVTDPAELLDADFLDALTRLRIVARRVPRGGRFADQSSQALGSGLEFKDYRPYTPGDDLRAIDWNIYRRMGRVFVRLFEELEDLPVYLLPDVSASAFVETPPRGRAGLRAALALGAVALGQHDSVGVFPFSDDLRIALPPSAGKGRVWTLANAMARIEVGGATDIERSLKRFGAMRLRRGLAVIVSDYFDPRGIEALRAGLRHVRHQVLFVQLTRPSDSRPDLEGDLRLVDCESGSVCDVSVTGDVVRRYREAYARFEGELMDVARKRGAGLLRLDVEEPVVPQLAKLFESGTLRV